MSSEIISGLKAATCTDPSGELFVALFKFSRSTSSCPSNNAWLCVHFGDYPSAIRYVLLDAALCESGMIHSATDPDRRTLPEAHIGAWRAALKAPLPTPARRVIVPASTGVNMSAIANVLGERGLTQRKSAWLEFDLGLPGHAAAMAACVARHRETKLQPWLCFGNDMALLSALEDRASGPVVPEARRASTAEVLERMNGIAVWELPFHSDAGTAARSVGALEPHHVLVTPGKVTGTGWAFSTMETFIAEVALPAELAHPGIAEQLIEQFRALLGQAAGLPGHTVVMLQRPNLSTPSHESIYARIAAALGHAGAPRVLTSIQELSRLPDTQELLELAADQVVFPELLIQAAYCEASELAPQV